MPIEQLSDVRRLTRDFKIRLGGRVIKGSDNQVRDVKPGEEGGYPRESEFFVMVPTEVPEDVMNAYGPEPRSLRMMLPFEWDATDPMTGDELVFNRYNRAYARTKGLRCKGTGYSAEFPGVATTSDQAWATRIAQASGQAFETINVHGNAMFSVLCQGTDCPKYLRTVEEHYDREGGGRGTRMVKAEGVDADAACKRVFILRAFLLEPTVDPNSPNYCRVLGLVEIASSSFNTMVNLQSDFPMMKVFTNGQTAGIPFRLERKPIFTYKPTRQVHYVLKVATDPQEMGRMAAVPMLERFQSQEMRARLRQIAASPLAPTYDTVSDLIPTALLEAPVAGKADQGAGVTREVPGEIPDGSPAATETPAGDRKLLKGELDELKELCTPKDIPDPVAAHSAGLTQLKEIIALYNSKNGTAFTRYSDLTYDVYCFVKEYLSSVIPPEA